MARHLRRLTTWLLGVVAALLVLALLVLAALWWFLDPDDYRTQIEARASSLIGRSVHLTGRLRWQLGRQILIVSEGGEIGNAAGFGSAPLARWSRIRLGVQAQPLLHKRVLIDRIDVEGLQVQLQRNAAGVVNWALQPAAEDSSTPQALALRIGSVAVHDATLQYQDERAGSSWNITALQASAKLPEDLHATDREFREVKVDARISGGPLPESGVAFAMQVPALWVSPQRLQAAMFALKWADASAEGGIQAQLDTPDVAATLHLQAPSLRRLLATVGAVPPPMRDATTLGALRLNLALRYTTGVARFDNLSLDLDGTHVEGWTSLPTLHPFAMRFELAADRIDLDRYRTPVDANSGPLELPLAWLKKQDVKGTLRVHDAIIAGVATKEVRIDVE